MVLPHERSANLLPTPHFLQQHTDASHYVSSSTYSQAGVCQMFEQQLKVKVRLSFSQQLDCIQPAQLFRSLQILLICFHPPLPLVSYLPRIHMLATSATPYRTCAAPSLFFFLPSLQPSTENLCFAFFLHHLLNILTNLHRYLYIDNLPDIVALCNDPKTNMYVIVLKLLWNRAQVAVEIFAS
jgi:hypothetical protein